MSLQTYDALNDQIDVIREEEEIGANTKERIAQMYQNIIDSAVVNGGAGVHTLAFPIFSTSGTDTYTASPTPAITSYANNQKFIVKVGNASAGAVTLNLSGAGAKKVFKNPTTQAGSGDIPANQILILAYDSTLDSGTGGLLMLGSASSTGAGVETVTGDGVGGTATNPVISYPTPGDIGAATTGSVTDVASDLSDHIADTADAHAASAISNTPAGGIAATTVQAALNELDGDKQPALGFTPENVANKATDFTTLNNTLYPSVQAVENRVLSALAGLKWKDSVRVATTVAGTLATSFENGDTVDGIALATGNRILIKNQADQTENGIYVVNASGAPTRSTDADSAAELEGAAVSVQQGTSNENTTWSQITDGITIGASNIVFTQFGSSVPDATSSTKGIAKLYDSTSLGTNTDGAPDQNAVKSYVDTGLSGKQNSLGFTAENVANKATDLTSPDNIKYPTTLATFNQYDHKFDTINTQTGDYTLVLTDKDTKTVVMDVVATSNAVTIPPNSSVAFPIGTKIAIAQMGTGLTSVAAGVGVTIRPSKGDLTGQGQYSAMLIEKVATDEWLLLNGPGPIAGAAFTRVNDTNVTAVLSGSPSAALLAAVEITLGWTGTLAVTRGGTGLAATANGDVVIGTNTNVIGVVNALATSRTAYWHLKAGTATASTAPLKFTSGTNLTTPENGAVEYNGTNYFVTSGGVRYTLAKVLSNSAVIDFGSVSAVSQVENTITVTGAADGDEVILGYTNAAANAGLIFTARVSATDTVTVTAYNITDLPIDPASATYKVSVIKR